MPSIDPKENLEKDLEIIKLNVYRGIDVAKALEEIGFQRDVYEAVSPWWKSINQSDFMNGSVASAAGTVHLWAEQTERMSYAGETFLHECQIAASAAANTASSTGTLSEINPKVRFVSEKTAEVLSRRVQRGKIKEALNLIAPLLADEFETVWQLADYPVSDAGRAPLSQIREFFTHFLHKLAPDGEVIGQKDFKPDRRVKNKSGNSKIRVSFDLVF